MKKLFIYLNELKEQGHHFPSLDLMADGSWSIDEVMIDGGVETIEIDGEQLTGHDYQSLLDFLDEKVKS